MHFHYMHQWRAYGSPECGGAPHCRAPLGPAYLVRQQAQHEEAPLVMPKEGCHALVAPSYPFFLAKKMI